MALRTNMKIALGGDHRGFKLKQFLHHFITEKGHAVTDVGAPSYNQDDDYTLYAQKVAVMVSRGEAERGVLLCGSGVGVDITANKFDGVRASIGFSKDQVKAGRSHDDMNVLVIAADYLSLPDAKKLVLAFLETSFDKKARHKRRLEDIERIEENN